MSHQPSSRKSPSCPQGPAARVRIDHFTLSPVGALPGRGCVPSDRRGCEAQTRSGVSEGSPPQVTELGLTCLAPALALTSSPSPCCSDAVSSCLLPLSATVRQIWGLGKTALPSQGDGARRLCETDENVRAVSWRLRLLSAFPHAGAGGCRDCAAPGAVCSRALQVCRSSELSGKLLKKCSCLGRRVSAEVG